MQLTNLLSINESIFLSNELGINSKACTRPKNIIQSEAFDNKQLKNILEKKLKMISNTYRTNLYGVWRGHWKTRRRHAPLHENALREGTLHIKWNQQFGHLMHNQRRNNQLAFYWCHYHPLSFKIGPEYMFHLSSLHHSCLKCNLQWKQLFEGCSHIGQGYSKEASAVL